MSVFIGAKIRGVAFDICRFSKSFPLIIRGYVPTFRADSLAMAVVIVVFWTFFGRCIEKVCRILCSRIGVESTEFGTVAVLVSLNADAATPVAGLDYIGLGIIVGVIVIQVLGHPCLCAYGDRLVILPVAGIF